MGWMFHVKHEAARWLPLVRCVATDPVRVALGHPVRTARREGVPRVTHSDSGVADPDVADPLVDDDRVMAFLGDAYAVLARFHGLLIDQGVVRGLLGPRESFRLWERHLLNSAAAAQFLPVDGRLIDLGSGAGLPGIVLAAMLPDVEVMLLEPMERRAEWLVEVAAQLRLPNIEVRRGRAEELHGTLEVAAVTARAVAPMDRLGRWALPLLVRGGVLVALKGRRAVDEVDAARSELTRLGAGEPEIFEASTIAGVGSTTVVRVVRENVRGSSSAQTRARRGAARERERDMRGESQ